MREKERVRGGREKDKKTFRVGERKIGRETMVVERERQESERKIKKIKKRDRSGRERESRRE